METITYITTDGTTGRKTFTGPVKAMDWLLEQGQITLVGTAHTDRFGHRDADTTPEAHTAEIKAVLDLGADGPHYCNKHYVGLAACERATGHDGEHRTTSLTGCIIGWDAK